MHHFKHHVVLCEPYSTYDPTITDSVRMLSVMLPYTAYGTFR